MNSALVLAGCTTHGTGDDLPEDYGQDWFALMSSQLSSDHGGGGGQLVVDDDDKDHARALVALQYDLAGPYDVLVVCRSTKTVHVVIRDFTNEHDANGESMEPRSRIGQADVRCGATRRIPIEVPEGRDGIMLDASTTDTSGRALFDASIVSRGSDE